jgi:hypothetical protein
MSNEDLSNILFFHLPKHRCLKSKWNIDVAKISADLEISPHTFHNWLRRGRLPAAKVDAIIDLPGSRLTRETLMPFYAR